MYIANRYEIEDICCEAYPCPRCGKYVDENDAYCRYCGHDLSFKLIEIFGFYGIVDDYTDGEGDIMESTSIPTCPCCESDGIWVSSTPDGAYEVSCGDCGAHGAFCDTIDGAIRSFEECPSFFTE